ncbi:Protein DSE1 [Nakaseomyces bracarensis]|uniref:Protein DSE1 n=1 Tax=Nakaseomyces bracarensis TaxID=273131 RepID=A0ABR4NW91_9SACH
MYYEPVNIFRQPAISVRKRGDTQPPSMLDTHSSRVSSWQNNSSRMSSPILRKVSDDYYLLKRVRSDYWELEDMKNTSTSFSTEGDLVMVTNNNATDNLKLLRVLDNDKLRVLQTITVPGGPITAACLLPVSQFDPHAYVETHDQLILTGHQDGIVNLISTSIQEGTSKIVKRYNHRKHMVSTLEAKNLDNEINMLLTKDQKVNKMAMPVTKLRPWNGLGFVSMINDCLFVFTLNNTKTPQYLDAFPGIKSFAVQNHDNPYLLGLTGSFFGAHNVALLDLKKTLYIPDPEVNPQTLRLDSARVAADCTWISGCYLAQALGTKINIWDVRRNDGKPKCVLTPGKGVIESLIYYNESETLFSADDQGNIISWDLANLDQMEQCGLIHGLEAAANEFSKKELLNTNFFQCGNVIVSGQGSDIESTRKQTRYIQVNQSNGKLFSYSNNELGVHQIYAESVGMNTNVSDTETLQGAEVSYELIDTGKHTDSDHDHEAAVSFMHSDSTTLHSRDFDSHSDCVSTDATDHEHENREIITINFEKPNPTYVEEKLFSPYGNSALKSSESTLEVYEYF